MSSREIPTNPRSPPRILRIGLHPTSPSSQASILILTVPRLRIATALTQVNVGYSAEEVATEQVRVQEQQRIFGVIPNFYVTYD